MMTHSYDVGSREVRELTLLVEISRRLADALDLHDALKPVLPLMAEHLDILRGSVTILNRDTGEISIDEAYGLRPEEQERGRYRLGEGITGQVIHTGREISRFVRRWRMFWRVFVFRGNRLWML